MLTTSQIVEIASTKAGPIVQAFVDTVNQFGAAYEVDSWLRVCHFIAQCAEESDHFNTTIEYASGSAYEGRTDLGNVQPGDGVRFKGRGVIQLTGRTNYHLASEALGVDLVAQPALAAEPKMATLVALWYWHVHNCAALADSDLLEAVTRKINGGLNGLIVRSGFLAKAKKVIPHDYSAALAPTVVQLAPKAPAVPVFDLAPKQVPATKGFWASLFTWLATFLPRSS